MTTIYVNPGADVDAAPIHLNLHVVATLNISPEEARRRVNRQIVTELGTGLVARIPNLVVMDERIVWRVPVVLSLSDLGDLGEVGCIDVDARSGEVFADASTQQGMIQHASRLYAGSTLSTK